MAGRFLGADGSLVSGSGTRDDRKRDRPHRATNALLAGFIYCLLCHQRLNVISESGRYTHGKPRFKYACPNAVRKGVCDYQAVHGVEFDEFIEEKLSSLSDEEQNYYLTNIQRQIDQTVKGDKTQQEIPSLQKEIDRLDRDIKAQVKALRTASESTRPYLEADINEMTEEIFAKRKTLSKLEMELEDQQAHIRDYEKIKETLLSFRELVKDAEPTEIVSLIGSIVERVYVTRDGKNEVCHIYIKGCVTEDYSGEEDYFFGRSGTLETESEETSVNTFSQDGEMCDSEGDRKLYSYVCRNSAQKCLCRDNGKTGGRGTDLCNVIVKALPKGILLNTYADKFTMIEVPMFHASVLKALDSFQRKPKPLATA